MKLDQYQEEILNYDGNILLCTGRQVGKTTIMARKCAEFMLARPASKIIIVSLTEDQAKLIIVMILDYLEKNFKKWIARGTNKPTQNRITLTNKSQAIARPVGNTGEAVRGFTGDVLLIDEGSRMPELAFQAARPTLLTTAGQIWICSTPFGKQGFFYESFLNKNGRFKVFHVSSEEVINTREINEFWTEKKKTAALQFLEEEKKDKSKTYYGQEYLGLFLDDLQQFFDDELIRKVCVLRRPEVIDRTKKYIMGNDLARMGGDQFTAEILKIQAPLVIKHVENIAKKFLTTVQNEQEILDANTIWNPEKIGIDSGSGTIGVSVLDHLRTTAIKRKIIPMNNRQISLDRDGKSNQRLMKEDFYNNLRGMMQRGEIELLDDEDVKLSLKSVQMEVNQEDTTIAQVKIFGNYTHIAEGLVRAAWLAKGKGLNFDIGYI